MKLFSLLAIPTILLLSQAAHALEVELLAHNPCVDQNKQCFRLEVFLDGIHTASYVTSPGRPSKGAFPGENTPERFQRAPITSAKGKNYRSVKRGDYMPYAMHIQNTGFAIHGSLDTVNGKKASHGCLRLKVKDAAQLNAWVREARETSGYAVITVMDTEKKYPKQ